jgi:hypothetical protein
MSNHNEDFKGFRTGRPAKPKLSIYVAGEQHKKRLQYAASDVGRLTEIVGVIFAETGGVAKNRPFLDALLGIAKGRIDWDKQEAVEFPASRQTLAKQLQKSAPGLAWAGQEMQLQSVERMAKRFFSNQEAAGVIWVEKRLVFNSETRRNEPTRYRLPILAYALEALHRAKSNREGYRSDRPGSVYERAAREVAAELLAGAAATRMGQDKPKRQQSVEHTLKQTLGMMRSLRKKLEADGYDHDLTFQTLSELAVEAMNDMGGKSDPPLTVNHGGIGILAPRDYSSSLGLNSSSGRGVNFDPPLGPRVSDLEGSSERSIAVPLGVQLEDIEAFESVGCMSFDLSLTTEDKVGRGYFPGLSADELKQKLTEIFDMAERDCLNTIIRPHVDQDSPIASLIQLDDLHEEKVKRVAKLAFRIIETSPGNYQAFVAGDFYEGMRGRLISGIGADAGANGWTRIAGSLNVKAGRRQPDGGYPRVRSAGSEFGAEPGRITNGPQLQQAGLLNECSAEGGQQRSGVEKSTAAPRPPSRLKPRGKKRPGFPDYQKVTKHAAAARTDAAQDRSVHDFVWAFIAADWGRSEEETIEELLRVSPKAQEKGGRKYAERTVAKAISYFQKALAGNKVQD